MTRRTHDEDGSSSTRDTCFLFEEEAELFMPGVPFEEFVEAR